MERTFCWVTMGWEEGVMDEVVGGEALFTLMWMRTGNFFFFGGGGRMLWVWLDNSGLCYTYILFFSFLSSRFEFFV